MIESEFWRNLFIQTRARGVERTVVNGQASASSYASWRRARPLIAHLLGLFSLTLAQSRADQIRLPERGVADSKCLGNLKFAAQPLAADPEEVTGLGSRFARPV